MLGGCCWWWVACVCGNDVRQRRAALFMPNKLLKMCARKIRQNAFSFALLIVQNLKTEGIFTKSRAYLDCEPYESPKQMPKCFRDFVSKSAKKIHFPGIFIGRYDLPPTMNGEIGGSAIQNRSGICIDQSFHSWRNICVLQESILTSFVATPRHSHTHTTYKMACIASSFTGSVAALKASKVQVRARAHHRARRRARAAPSPAFFSRGIRRHLSRSRPAFPSYLERI